MTLNSHVIGKNRWVEVPIKKEETDFEGCWTNTNCFIIDSALWGYIDFQILWNQFSTSSEVDQ